MHFIFMATFIHLVLTSVMAGECEKNLDCVSCNAALCDWCHNEDTSRLPTLLILLISHANILPQELFPAWQSTPAQYPHNTLFHLRVPLASKLTHVRAVPQLVWCGVLPVSFNILHIIKLIRRPIIGGMESKCYPEGLVAKFCLPGLGATPHKECSHVSMAAALPELSVFVMVAAVSLWIVVWKFSTMF